jgi:hypothetical protein
MAFDPSSARLADAPDTPGPEPANSNFDPATAPPAEHAAIPPMSGSVWDGFFSQDPTQDAAKTLSNFGQGLASNWGAYASAADDDVMKPFMNDVNAVHASIAKSFNEAALRQSAMRVGQMLKAAPDRAGVIYGGDVGHIWGQLKSDFVAGTGFEPEAQKAFSAGGFWDRMKSQYDETLAEGKLPVDAFNLVTSAFIGAPLDVAADYEGQAVHALAPSVSPETVRAGLNKAVSLSMLAMPEGGIGAALTPAAELEQARSLDIIGTEPPSGPSGPSAATAGVRGQVEEGHAAASAEASGGLGAPPPPEGVAPSPAPAPVAAAAPGAVEKNVSRETTSAATAESALTPPVRAPNTDELASALADVKERAAAAPQEQSLFNQIRSLGGIKLQNDSGELTQGASDLRQIMDTNRSLFNNKKGLEPDMMREALEERGWFGGNAESGRTDLNDMLDLIQREARGDNVYHPDSDIHDKIAYRELLDREQTEAGIKASDKPQEAARKLAEFRLSNAADFALRHQNEIDAAVEGLSHKAREALQSHGYEPGSDIGAEFEEPSGTRKPSGGEPVAGGPGAGAQVEGAAAGEPPVSAEEPRRPKLGTVRPVEGIGPLQARSLSEGVEARAIEQGLTKGFGDLPEYRQVSMADQANRAAAIIADDYENAKAIALGQKAPPKGVLPESVFVGVENRAIAEGDVETLRDLATQSRLTTEATTMGQRIRTLGERDETSPVAAIQEVQAARADAIKSRAGYEGAAKDEVSDMQTEIKATRAPIQTIKQALQTFAESIACDY